MPVRGGCQSDSIFAPPIRHASEEFSGCHQQVGARTVIFGGDQSYTVRIDHTKYMSAVILSAVDSRTMRNHQPLGRWVGTVRGVYVHIL